MKQRTKVEIEAEIKKVTKAMKAAARKLDRCDDRLSELNLELEGADEKQ